MMISMFTVHIIVCIFGQMSGGAAEAGGLNTGDHYGACGGAVYEENVGQGIQRK